MCWICTSSLLRLGRQISHSNRGVGWCYAYSVQPNSLWHSIGIWAPPRSRVAIHYRPTQCTRGRTPELIIVFFFQGYPLSIPPGGSTSPHSLELHGIRLTPTYGTPHNRLREHRKQSVLEFYLPSRLLHHTPQFILLTSGKTIQDRWERPTCHLHETQTHHIQHMTHYISQKTPYIENPNTNYTSIHLQLPPILGSKSMTDI